MMAAEAMPKGGGSDDEGQGNHSVFEKGIVDNVDSQDGQRSDYQRQHGTVDGAEDRSGDAQGVQVELSEHGRQK